MPSTWTRVASSSTARATSSSRTRRSARLTSALLPSRNPLGSAFPLENSNEYPDPFGWRLSLHSGGFAVFGRRGGRSGLSHRAGAVLACRAAARRLRPDREAPRAPRAPERGLLRLRAALAGPVHRAGLPRVHRDLHRHAQALGRHRG